VLTRARRAPRLDLDGREALKSALNAHALVHPEHPLRVKGEDGVRVYIGVPIFPCRAPR
jgi:hypothetical protein